METIFRDLTISGNLDGQIMAAEQTLGRTDIRVHWDETIPAPYLRIVWAIPVIDIQYEWHPNCKMQRTLHVDWQGPIITKISSSAPVIALYNAAGRNRLTIALSDALTETAFMIGVREENGMMICRIDIPLDETGATHDYAVTLYRDMSNISLAESLRRVSRWWETDCGMTPMPVPDDAKNAMYSFWYSFHQATFAEKVEQECARVKQLGLHTVIVDDGWQTEDGHRGYAYCGDWEPAQCKIPDMKQHVQNVHALGLKYILWYSVPFVGIYSKNWEKFKDKIIGMRGTGDAGILDPRYPEVRQFLIDTYKSALLEWDLDGFKLDFIDQFRTPDEQFRTPKPGMDYALVEPAVKRLMTDIMTELRKIKPGIMIEFRQRYIGPEMRTFGNMFRVGDCPDDPLSNRVGSIDLRLLSGNTAVHSDMLMWHQDDTPEAAALQLLSSIFAVVQVSVKLDTISEKHRELLSFWLSFMKEHRDILLETPLEVEAPQHLYPLVRAEKGGQAVIALYDGGRIAKVSETSNDIYILNATPDTMNAIYCDSSRRFHVECTDCCGNVTSASDITLGGLCALQIPVSGMAHLTAL